MPYQRRMPFNLENLPSTAKNNNGTGPTETCGNNRLLGPRSVPSNKASYLWGCSGRPLSFPSSQPTCRGHQRTRPETQLALGCANGVAARGAQPPGLAAARGGDVGTQQKEETGPSPVVQATVRPSPALVRGSALQRRTPGFSSDSGSLWVGQERETVAQPP